MPDQGTRLINGQPHTWQGDTHNQDAFDYLGPASGFQTAEAARAADEASGQGSWVQASFDHPNGSVPKWLLAGMIGGPALVAGAGALPGLFAGGAGAGGAGAAGAGAATVADATAVPASMLSGAGAGGGILSSIAKYAPLLNMAGRGISAAAGAAAQNRGTTAEFNQQSNDSLERALQARALIESRQRATDSGNLYKASVASNLTHSPYSGGTAQTFSPAFLQALKDLEAQGRANLAAPPRYSMATLPPPVRSTIAPPGILERIGGIAGPALTALGGR